MATSSEIGQGEKIKNKKIIIPPWHMQKKKSKHQEEML